MSEDEFELIKVDTTPPMRGIQPYLLTVDVPRRYNPAHAGNTLDARRDCGFLSIQPRPCGESDLRGTGEGDDGDTTPPMRGIPIMYDWTAISSRYNPAHAGNTSALQ